MSEPVTLPSRGSPAHGSNGLSPTDSSWTRSPRTDPSSPIHAGGFLDGFIIA